MTDEQKIQEQSSSHEQWRASQNTQQLIRLLTEHKSRIVKSLSTHAMNIAGISDQAIRQFTVQLQTVDTILNLITHTETFVTKSNELNK